MSYNFTDPLVARLINSTHTPTEIPPVSDVLDPTRPIELTLICGRCRNVWPCPPVQQYRDYITASQAVAVAQARDAGSHIAPGNDARITPSGPSKVRDAFSRG